MSISDRRVGDKMAPKMDSSYRNRFKCVTLKAYTTFQGVKYWWVTATTHDDYTTLETISDLSLEWFEKEAAFFKSEHVYKYPYSGSGMYQIAELYSVDNPAPDGSETVAVARVTRQGEYGSISLLGRHDYDLMEEVK